MTSNSLGGVIVWLSWESLRVEVDEPLVNCDGLASRGGVWDLVICPSPGFDASPTLTQANACLGLALVAGIVAQVPCHTMQGGMRILPWVEFCMLLSLGSCGSDPGMHCNVGERMSDGTLGPVLS